jgi:C-terminal processing protease CtpA/Prc
MEINRETLLQSFRQETEECLAQMEQSLKLFHTDRGSSLGAYAGIGVAVLRAHGGLLVTDVREGSLAERAGTNRLGRGRRADGGNR